MEVISYFHKEIRFIVYYESKNMRSDKNGIKRV